MASMNPETKQYARDSRKRIDGLSRELATVRALLENNPAIDPTAAGRLTRLETDMQAIKARMEAFGDQPPQVILDAMKTESARLEKRLDDFHADLDARIVAAQQRADDAHDRIDAGELKLTNHNQRIEANAEAAARAHARIDGMTHTPPWVWVIGVVSGVIAGFIWASVDFGRRAQLGEATATVTSVADDLWVAVLFGASVALAVVGIIGFFVRQTQTATASSGATARVSVGNNPDAPNGAPNGGNATQPTRVATTTPPPPAGNPPAGTDGASQPPTPAPASRRLRNPFRRDTGSQPANPTPTPNQAGGSTNASAAAGAGAAVSRS